MGRIVRNPTADNPYIRALRHIPEDVARNPTRARAAYLAQLADDYGVSLKRVQAFANLLGPGEDFDGLVSHLNELPF